MDRLRGMFIVLVVVVMITLPMVPGRVKAERIDSRGMASTPMEIIAAVNALRATQGLAPYTVDSGLMDYARQHAEYQASIDTSTHTHSDGTTAWTVGLEENIAAGDSRSLTAEYAVFTIWQDPIHLKPMIGFVNGAAGAGVASNGTTIYYTFNVRPTGGSPVSRKGNAGADPGVTSTPIIPIVPVVTATPRGDGTIWHEVGYGQTIWEIANAYGVNADSLCGLNSMEAGCTQIFAGVRLLIRWKGPTPTPDAETFAKTTAIAAVAQAAVTPEAGLETGLPQPTPSMAVPTDQRAGEIPAVAEGAPPAQAAQSQQSEPDEAGTPARVNISLLLAGVLIAVGGVLLAIIAISRTNSYN